VSKSRGKKSSKGKAKHAAPEPSSFDLSLGWVAAETLVVPGTTLLLLLVVIAKFSDAASLAAQVGILAAFVAIRGPLLVYTLLRDRRIDIRNDALHIPIVHVFQFRPWTIPLADLVSVSETRKSGGSAKIVIAMRGGSVKRFGASVLRDRHRAIKALDRRARGAHPG
jgi:hypothetical protein